jgi:hypothetical protein
MILGQIQRAVDSTELTLIPTRSAIAPAVQWVRSSGGGTERECHHPLGNPGRQRWDARWPRLVAQQAVHALLYEAVLPAPDNTPREIHLAHNLCSAAAGGGQQNDAGAPDMFLRAVAICNDRGQPLAIAGGTSTTIPVHIPYDSHTNAGWAITLTAWKDHGAVMLFQSSL